MFEGAVIWDEKWIVFAGNHDDELEYIVLRLPNNRFLKIISENCGCGGLKIEEVENVGR